MNHENTPEELDSAERLRAAVNLHVSAVLAEGFGRERPGFIAVRLADGSPADEANPLYDSRADATRHNIHDTNVFYIKIGKEHMPLDEALIVLQMHRMARKRGVVFTEEEIITPQLPELMQQFIPRTLRGIRENRR